VLTVRPGFFDEMLDDGGAPHPHARTLVEALTALGAEALAAAGRRRDAIFMQQDITFDAAGPDADGPVRDRPFPHDLVPRIIPAAEWTTIKRGLAQRIRALNHFIDDVYHGREIVHEGLVPWELIVSRSGFACAAHGIRPPGGVYGAVRSRPRGGLANCGWVGEVAVPTGSDVRGAHVSVFDT
jgi:uncharacterized circularly permuted ATP-grasp superfamily protein